MKLAKIFACVCAFVVYSCSAFADTPALKTDGMYKILSLDGGGQRGLITAVMMHELEKRTGIPIASSFDSIAGTSTGALAGTIYSLPSEHDPFTPKFSAEDVVKIYTERGKKIFKTGHGWRFKKVLQLEKAAYDRSGLDKIIDGFVGKKKPHDKLKKHSDAKSSGGARLSDIQTTRLVITGFDTLSYKPVIFSSYEAMNSEDDDWYVGDAARVSSAAPTYFDPVQIYNVNGTRKVVGIDGGMFANNPSTVGAAYARMEYPKILPHVVSVGTGVKEKSVKYASLKKRGLLGWARSAPDILMRGAAQVTHENIAKVLGDQYVRFQTDLVEADDAMDDYSKKQLRGLVADARQTIHTRADDFGKVVELLKDRSHVPEKRLVLPAPDEVDDSTYSSDTDRVMAAHKAREFDAAIKECGLKAEGGRIKAHISKDDTRDMKGYLESSGFYSESSDDSDTSSSSSSSGAYDYDSSYDSDSSSSSSFSSRRSYRSRRHYDSDDDSDS